MNKYSFERLYQAVTGKVLRASNYLLRDW